MPATEHLHQEDRVEQEARHANRPAALLGRVRSFAGERLVVGLAQLVARPGLQDGTGQVGDAEGGLDGIARMRWIPGEAFSAALR